MWKSIVDFLVWQPNHFWAIAAVFGALAVVALVAKFRYPQVCCLPSLLAAIIWTVFGFLEYQAYVERANIRIDIVFLWPILFIATILLILISLLSVIVAFLCGKGE